jgi:hypothetical protein
MDYPAGFVESFRPASFAVAVKNYAPVVFGHALLHCRMVNQDVEVWIQ